MNRHYRRFALLLLLLLAALKPLHAVTCRTIAAGLLTADTTWGPPGVGCVGAAGTLGLGIPGAGDDVIHAHDITVNASWTIGNSAGNYAVAGSTAITAATNASPIQITSTAHGYATGNVAVIASVGGNTAANGVWVVTVIDPNTFTLNGSTGNGAYTSGGTSVRVTVKAAIQRAGGNGIVNVQDGFTLSVQGDVIDSFANATANNAFQHVQLQPGGSYQFDSSATSPTSTTYVQGGDANSRVNAGIRAICTAAKPCNITSNAGGGNGRFDRRGFIGAPSIVVSHGRFVRIGDASNPLTNTSLNGAGLPGIDIEFSTFDACGAINPAAGPSVGTTPMRLHANHFTNALSTCDAQLPYTIARTGAPSIWALTENWFGRGYGCAAPGSVIDATIDDNAARSTSAIPFRWIATTGAPTSQKRNLFLRLVVSGEHPVVAAVEEDSHIWKNDDLNNIHGATPNNSRNSEVRDLLCETTSMVDPHSGECITTGQPSTNVVFTMRGMVAATAATGTSSGPTITLLTNGTTVTSRWSFFFLNNTYNMGSSTTTAATFNFGESTNPSGVAFPTGVVQQFYGNLGFSNVANAGRGKFAYTGGTTPNPATLDIALPANILNNYGHQYESPCTQIFCTGLTNLTGGYPGDFTSTPGTTDTDFQYSGVGGPQFVDQFRSSPRFSREYLGVPSIGSWASFASSHTFNVGDVVTHVKSGMFGNAIINYRCIQSHVKSTANSEPYTTAVTWRTFWQFDTEFRISEAYRLNAIGNTTVTNLPNGAVQTGGKVTDHQLGVNNQMLTSALRRWVRAGYVPQNNTLRGRGVAGGVVGAMPMSGLLPALLN
jgi:hypothetical protein